MTQVQAEIGPSGKRVDITCNQQLQNLAMTIPGALWDSKRATVHVPLSWAACLAMRGVFEELLLIGPNLTAWAIEERARRIDPAMQLRQALDVAGLDDGWYKQLRPFQRATVAWLGVSEQALLATPMGGGKTVEALGGVRRLAEYGHDVFPLLVVAPVAVLGSWAEHVEEWLPGARAVVVNGTAPQRAKQLATDAEVFIINWEAVRLHSRLAPHGNIRLAKCEEHKGTAPTVAKCEVHPKELNLKGFRSVIVDEAHRMKDPSSKQTRAIWAVQHGATVRYRFALTGTPIASHPGDLYGIMHGLVPEEWPTKSGHESRYCLQQWTIFGDLKIVGIQPATRAEFFGFFDPRFRRLPKDLILPDLPPKVREVRHAPMSPKQKTAYTSMRDKMMLRTEEGHLVVADGQLAQQTRLMQLSSAECEVTNPEADEFRMVKSQKMAAMLDVIEEAGGGQVVVCAEHRQLIELAAKTLETKKISHEVLVGGMTHAQIADHVRRLQQGEIRVLLFTLKVGGVGLTMTAASTIVFLQRSWSMIDNAQAEDRVHRIGSEKHSSITIVDIVAPGTKEVDQIRTLHRKAERLEEIARDRATADANQVRLLELEEAAILASDLIEDDEMETTE